MSFWAEPLFPLGSPAWLGMTFVVVALAVLVVFWRKIQQFALKMSVLIGLSIFVGTGAVLGGGVWLLMRAIPPEIQKTNGPSVEESAESAAIEDESAPTEAHPLLIIDPSPQLIRTQILRLEGSEDKKFYRNIYLLGVQNTSPEQKTMRSVQLKFWLMDTPRNCKIYESNETSVDLNPGDIAYFEIGYLDSRERWFVVRGSRRLQREQFDGVYYNARGEFFRLGTGEGESSLNFMIKHMDQLSERARTMTFQFSADDMPPLFFHIVVHRDADNEIRLEHQPFKPRGQ